jgi:RNA polymerase sigma-70 factor (ECF subfamily)
MDASSQDSAVLSFPATALSPPSAASTTLEEEVMEFFVQFRKPVLRYVCGLGATVHDGEEIAQEVFLALFRHLCWGRSRRNLRAWIFRVAHNLALKQRFADQKAHARTAGGEFLMETRIDPEMDPEQRMLHLQRQWRLLAVVNVLPEKDQCCLRLRAEGLRYREIARALNISLGAVSISLTRSLARLQSAAKAWI